VFFFYIKRRKSSSLEITSVMDTQISSYLGSGNYRIPFMKRRQIMYKSVGFTCSSNPFQMINF
jgi:hypothetical protein